MQQLGDHTGTAGLLPPGPLVHASQVDDNTADQYQNGPAQQPKHCPQHAVYGTQPYRLHQRLDQPGQQPGHKGRNDEHQHKPSGKAQRARCPPIGSRTATSAANHWAATKATIQPSTDSTSNTKPRTAPSTSDMPKTASTAQSSSATEYSTYRDKTEADKARPLILLAAFSASVLPAKGPTLTRVRGPSLVLTTWV